MITRIKWKGHEHEWNFSRWYVIYTHHNRNINNKYHKYTSWVCLCVFTSKSHLIKCYVVRRFVAEMYDCYFLLLLFVCMFVTPQSNVKLIYKMHKGFKYIWTIKDWQEKKTKKEQNTSVWFPIKVFIVTITVVVVRFYGFNMSSVSENLFSKRSVL